MRLQTYSMPLKISYRGVMVVMPRRHHQTTNHMLPPQRHMLKWNTAHQSEAHLRTNKMPRVVPHIRQFPHQPSTNPRSRSDNANVPLLTFAE